MKNFNYLAASWTGQEVSAYAIGGFLTMSGNILLSASGRYFFVSAEGKFLREAGESQYKFLTTVCPTVVLTVEYDWLKWDEKFPEWAQVGRYCTSRDLTSYKPETGCNGGDYAFYQYAEVYAAVIEGEMKLRMVPTFGTSADFDGYDELAGSFQAPTKSQYVNNAPSAHFRTQQASDDLYLEQISSEITLCDLLNMETTIEEVSPETGETKARHEPALSDSQKESALDMFRQMGFAPKITRRGEITKLERM